MYADSLSIICSRNSSNLADLLYYSGFCENRRIFFMELNWFSVIQPNSSTQRTYGATWHEIPNFLFIVRINIDYC